MINQMPKQIKPVWCINNTHQLYNLHKSHLYKKNKMHIQYFERIPHPSSVRRPAFRATAKITVSRFGGWSCYWNLAGVGHANLSCHAARGDGSSILRAFFLRSTADVTLCTCDNTTVRFLERGYRWKIMDVMLLAHADACMWLFI